MRDIQHEGSPAYSEEVVKDINNHFCECMHIVL